MKSNDKGKTKGPVVVFRSVRPPQIPKPTAKPISQMDLEEYILLTREMKEAIEAWKEKRQYIRRALAAGAEIEPGIHSARQTNAVLLTIR